MHSVSSRLRATRLRWLCDRHGSECPLHLYFAPAAAMSRQRQSHFAAGRVGSKLHSPCAPRSALLFNAYEIARFRWCGSTFELRLRCSRTRNCKRNFELAGALAAAATPPCNSFVRGSSTVQHLGCAVAMHILWLRGRVSRATQCNAFAVSWRS